jgi:hypothetical protein
MRHAPCQATGWNVYVVRRITEIPIGKDMVGKMEAEKITEEV